MNNSARSSRADSMVHLVLNPVVEREYAYLIEQAEREKNSRRVAALKVGLARARRRAEAEDKKKAA